MIHHIGTPRYITQCVWSLALLTIILFLSACVSYPVDQWERWPASSPARYPAETWLQYATPEEAGWSSQKLEAARAYYEGLDSAAVIIVYDGAILAAWGDVERRFKCHSIRKSFLSALYGIHHDAGRIDLDKTLEQLQIDDDPPLTDREKRARVRDLLKSRSGVYHEAAYETAGMKKRRPSRGSYAHGTHWYYNNWDFNVLGTIFNQETDSDLFEEFEQRLAIPLQMEHFRSFDTYYHLERSSIHPAYLFRLSAKDMARFGLLYERGGHWQGNQIISEAWIQESTESYSWVNPERGYGYLWWIQTGGRFKKLGMYSALGYRGHAIDIFPRANLVVVHRVDTDVRGTRVSSSDRLMLLNKILQARTSEPKAHPKLVALP